MIDFDMGQYGAYVWPAWGVSAVVMAALVVRCALSARRWKAELKRLESNGE